MADKKLNLRKNVDWFYANLRCLLPKYRGRVIAFAHGDMIGAYDDTYEAARSAIDSGYSFGAFAEMDDKGCAASCALWDTGANASVI